MKFEAKVTGATAMQQSILALAKAMPKRIGDALWAEAELTMTEAKELCPVMDGTLIDSGHVEPPEYNGDGISVTMGFGGAASAYALAVHENPRSGKTGGWGPKGPQDIQFRNLKTKAGRSYIAPIGAQRKRYATKGQWKYLEQPFLKRVNGLELRIRSRALGGV